MRQAELESEAQQRIAARYASRDQHRQRVQGLVSELVANTNREIQATLEREQADVEELGATRGVEQIGMPMIFWASDNRGHLLRAVKAEIAARVADAMLRLDRQEADLLQQLALHGLETDEARGFLAEIPNVSQLVPTDRLAELEAELQANP